MSSSAESSARYGATPGKDRHLIRWLVRSICLIVAAVLVLPAANGWSAAVPALSPFVAGASVLATRTVHALIWVALPVTCIVLLRPRWFCRWLCPLGLCADGVSYLGRRWGRRPMKSASPGQWIVWLTLGGACLGLPLLSWLDPLAMFTNLFRLAGPRSVPAAWIGIIPVSIALLLNLVWPHAWCGRICPLGALQNLLSRLAKRLLRIARRGNGVRPGSEGTGPLARRAVLGVMAGAASAWVVRSTRALVAQPLRPPGALDEPEFLGVCVRCGNCMRACPTGIIEPDLGGHGLASLLTPVLHFQDGYCSEDCTACTRVCPSGALVRLSLPEKPHVRIGLPQVDMNVCLLAEDRECAECKRWCPYEAIRYVFSEVEYTLTPQINPRKCTGCGACEVACPTTPKKAIVVVPRSA